MWRDFTILGIPNLNDTIGEVQVRGNAKKEKLPLSGNQILVTIGFKCTGKGECDLTIDGTELWDAHYRPIDYEPKNGKCIQEAIGTKPILINQSYTLCTDVRASGDLFVINADNVVLDLNNCNVSSANFVGTGVNVDGRRNICIQNGRIIDFQWGLTIKNCIGVSIINIAVWSSKVTGIEIMDCRDVQIVNSEITDMPRGEGILLKGSSNANISNNVVQFNPYGIKMEDSNSSTITKNTVANNRYMGMQVSNSFENIISNNNFFENGKNAESRLSMNNNWSRSYPEGGNYWDDWKTQSIVDDFSGKNGNIAGPDGIGDQPYVIDENNKDMYPLINLYNSTLQLFSMFAVYSNPSLLYPISDFSFDETLGCMSFNVRSGTFCRVIISKKPLDGAFKVLVDNNLTASILNWDDTNIFIDFNYSQGIHNIKITAEYARSIYEFPDISGLQGCPDGKIDICDLFAIAKNFGKTHA